MIDLHCHVLPGVDDGPPTAERAIALARGAFDDGITTIAATPHVDWSHTELNSRVITARVRTLQRQLDTAGIELEVVPGAELSATRAVDTSDAELERLALGGGPWLLLECPLAASVAPGFPDAARSLMRRGHRVLLAHPERSLLFLRSPALLGELIADGMLVQLTAGALSGRYGRPVKDFALTVLHRGAAHVVASDGHGGHRPAKIAAELSAAGIDQALIEWLARDVPAAILAGDTLPSRPAVARPRPRGRLRRLVRG